MKDTYTQALLDLLTPDADASAVIKGFKETLKERGHERLFETVLKNVLRVLEAERPSTVVTVANQKDVEKYAAEIKAALSELSAGDQEPLVKVDDTIIGGYLVENNRRRFDASFKSKLVDLYRSITT